MKPNLLKYLSIPTIVLIVVAGLVYQNGYTPTVQAGDGDCYNFEGTSSPIVAANRNEGMFNFAESVVGTSVKTCVETQKSYGQDHFVLKGWVWNVNLGWVSMGAFGNATAASLTDLSEYPTGVTANTTTAKSNRGISNGNYLYSSIAKVTSTSPAYTGELYGYWWGDNIGWIRLNCDDYYTTDTDYCATSNHKVTFSSLNKVDGKYRLSGYAWSNSVGWINLSGVLVDFDSARKEVLNIKMEVTSSTSNVIADGISGHQLSLKFLDQNNANITQSFETYIKSVNGDANPANDFNLCFLVRDDRKLDKVNNPEGQTLGQMTTCGDSRFTRFNSNINDFRIFPRSGVNTKYSLTADRTALRFTPTLKSIVPADEAEYQINKVLISLGTNSYTFDLARPVSLTYQIPFSAKIVKDKFNLTNAQCNDPLNGFNSFRMILAVPTPMNICGQFGPTVLGATAAPKVVVSFDSEELEAQYQGVRVYFDKATQVNGGESIPTTLLPVGNTGISVGGEEEPEASGITTIKQTLTKNQENSAPETLSEQDVIFTELGNPTTFNFSPTNFSENPFRAIVTIDFDELDEDVASDYITRLNADMLKLDIKSVLEYNVSPTAVVRRYGPELKQAYFRIDQIGSTGAVNDRAFTQIGSGANSAGSGSRTAIRDTFIKNIFEIVSSGKVSDFCRTPQVSATAIDKRLTGTTCKPSDKSNVYYLSNTNSKGHTSSRMLVDYEKLRPFFTNMDDAPKTLVLVGMDLYIGSNINASTENFPSIVLLTNNSKQGGNVYITPNVTEVNGFIFADKTIYSVQSLNMAQDVDPSGKPTELALRNYEDYFNEIAFIGRFFSENCIGCSLNVPPKKGDGTIATSVEEAQPYDFNYFRFSSLTVNTVFDAGDEVYLDCEGNMTDTVRRNSRDDEDYLCWEYKGTANSDYLQANLPTNEKDRRSVNFFYRAPVNVPLFTGL